MVALMREQKRLGHHVSAIIPSLDGSIAAQLAGLGIPCHAARVDVLFSLSFAQKFGALLKLAKLLRRLRPDVVHSHIVNSVVTARLASWIADVPMHFGANAHPFSMEADILRLIEAGTAFCDTATIASCTYTRELMRKEGVPEEQLELIYYAVDQSGHDPARADGARVRRELGIADDTPVVGNIAYFYPPATIPGLVPPRLLGRGVKGHDVLIRAIPSVLKSVPHAKFVLVGKGWGPQGAHYEAELKELVKSLAVEASVLFPGERSDVPDVLASFDIAVQCSLCDNLAGTVEALLMAKPLVVSDIGGFTDTVLHGQTGLAVPVDDPAALADALVRLLLDDELRRRLGHAGREHVLARFTLANVVADTEELLQRRRPSGRRYRRHVSIARTIALPFRLLPLSITVFRAMRRHGFRFWRFMLQRLLLRLHRIVAAVRRRDDALS